MSMDRCPRCGRLGRIYGGVCPDCRRVEAEEKRNKILENQAQQEKKAREEQARRERLRDEEDRKFREKQLRQEREDRLRQQEAEFRIQEERNQIERARFEAEQQEKREREWKEQQEREERERQKRERAWAERRKFLDNLSDEEMKILFETSSNSEERDYLKPRYRNCVSSDDYLELIKDENKYVMKKRIQQVVNTHPDKETVDYLLSVDPSWYAEIVEKEYLNSLIIKKEPLLKDFFDGNWLKEEKDDIGDFGDLALKACKLLFEKYNSTDKPALRQVILRIVVSYVRFLEMAPVDKQIFFREFVSDKMKDVEYNPDGYDSEHGLLFSMIEPFYIKSLPPEEQIKYLEKTKERERKFRAKQEAREKKDRRCAELQDFLKEKLEENKRIVEECDNIVNTREKISKEIDEINTIGKKYLSQFLWSIFIIGIYSFVFARIEALLYIGTIFLFGISVLLIVKKHFMIGILCALSFLSFLMTNMMLMDDILWSNTVITIFIIANLPLVVMIIYAVKRGIDVKRMNTLVQKKIVEHDEKIEKQNALAEKSAELINEMKKCQKEINNLNAGMEI